MTAIVGLRDTEGYVYIGGDSAGVAGLDISIRTDPKVFFNGPFLFGMCGSFRMGQLLHHAFVPPRHPENMDDYKFMCTHFIDAVRRCFKDGGYARRWSEQETGGCFLVGYHSRLYRIDSDYQVGIPGEGYAAVGCGDQIAHGAMFATRDIQNPERRVTLALEAAEHFSGGVRGPFVVKSLRPGLYSDGPPQPKQESETEIKVSKKAPAKKRTSRKKS